MQVSLALKILLLIFVMIMLSLALSIDMQHQLGFIVEEKFAELIGRVVDITLLSGVVLALLTFTMGGKSLAISAGLISAAAICVSWGPFFQKRFPEMDLGKSTEMYSMQAGMILFCLGLLLFCLALSRDSKSD